MHPVQQNYMSKEFNSGSDQVKNALHCMLVFTEKATKKSSCWHKYLRNETARLVDVFLHTQRGASRRLFTLQRVWKWREQKARSGFEEKPRGRGLMGLCHHSCFPSYRLWDGNGGLWAVWFLRSVLVFLISKQVQVITNIKGISHLSHTRGGWKSPSNPPASGECFSDRRIPLTISLGIKMN